MSEDGLWCAEVDAGQIGQVLHNILLNAKQASADGGSVDVRAENIPSGTDPPLGPGALVRITIRDHGSGIDAEILPLIFDPYFTTKGSGSGLGSGDGIRHRHQARRASHGAVEAG